MTTNQSNQTPSVVKKTSITDQVLEKVTQFEKMGQIKIPQNYSPENALKSAYLILLETKTMDKRPVLEACSSESIANALLKMIVQGLNPVKRQCSFIAYGNQLNLQREYAGSIALAKRLAGVKSVTSNAIFDGDEFTCEVNGETGRKLISKHIQTIESMGSNKVKGAYAIVELSDGTRAVEVMSMAQIQAAWNQGATKGTSPAHKNFPDQMAMKTVINRALKLLINSSDDSDLFDEEEQLVDQVQANVNHKIEQNANIAPLEFNHVDEIKDDMPPNAQPLEFNPNIEEVVEESTAKPTQTQGPLF
jgi:recombination protein RecT